MLRGEDNKNESEKINWTGEEKKKNKKKFVVLMVVEWNKSTVEWAKDEPAGRPHLTHQEVVRQEKSKRNEWHIFMSLYFVYSFFLHSHFLKQNKETPLYSFGSCGTCVSMRYAHTAKRARGRANSFILPSRPSSFLWKGTEEEEVVHRSSPQGESSFAERKEEEESIMLLRIESSGRI